MVAALAIAGCSSEPKASGERAECETDEDCETATDEANADDGEDESAVTDDDTPPRPVHDAGKVDASSSGAKDGGGSTPVRDAGNSQRDSGSPAGDAGGGSMLPDTSNGAEPDLPAISGECPEFKNGTIMVAGHGGVQLQVGAANKMGALVFVWHGTGGNAAQGLAQIPAAMKSEIIASGGILAAFNGSQSSQAEGDCSGTRAHNIADFKAADQIAACAVKNHGIDPRRIYTTGCSAGGLQSGCMAQLRSSYIAASAPNSGGVVRSQAWQNGGKPAIFTMHGGPSDMVGVAFSQTSATLDMSAKQHGSFVVNCNHGGGHCRAPADLYTSAWTFMKDHPYGAESPWKNGIPAGVSSFCTIF